MGKFRCYLVGYLGYDGSGDEENEKGDGNDLKSYRVRRGWVFYCNLLTYQTLTHEITLWFLLAGLIYYEAKSPLVKRPDSGIDLKMDYKNYIYNTCGNGCILDITSIS